MSRSLRIALDRNGLEIYYQPIFEKYGNQLIGFEAPIARGQFGRRFLFQPISRWLSFFGARCRQASSYPDPADAGKGRYRRRGFQIGKPIRSCRLRPGRSTDQ